jgi:sugar/nucleoside kinase (ribokinase family)
VGTDVLGLGAIAMDIFLGCERLPEEDGYAVIDGEWTTPGGSCANVITGLAGLGAKTGFIARLGDDAYGDALKADLEARGVSTRYISRNKGGTSMHTYVAVEKTGSKIIFCHMGDSLLSLTEEDVHAEMLEGVRVFYTAMQPGRPALKLARLCRERGVPVVCNLQVEPEFLDRCGFPGSLVEEMLRLCSLLVVYKNGLIRYTRTQDVQEAASVLFEAYRPEMGLLVTLGEKGALWVDREKTVTVPAFSVPARDTTGAGDAFIAGIIHSALLEGAGQRQAMRFASACAAITCTRPGPRLNASKEDIMDFIKHHETL